MKLPGVQYGGVQSLGRQDIGGPARLWAAKTGAAEAKAGALGKIADTLGAVYETVGKKEATDAMNKYNMAMQEYQTNTQWADTAEEGKDPTMQGAMQHFVNFEKQTREKIISEMGTGAGSSFFNAEADRANVRYTGLWGEQTNRWDKDRTLAIGTEYIDQQSKLRDYGAVYNKIDELESVGVLTAAEATEMRIKKVGEQKDYNVQTTISQIQSVAQADKVRSMVNADTSLSERAKQQYNASIDDTIINKSGEALIRDLVNIEQTQGAVAAAAYAERAVHSSLTIENDGLSEEGRMKHLTRLKKIANEWRIEAEGSTAQTKLMEEIECVRSGRCMPGSDPSMQVNKATDNYVNHDILGREYVKGKPVTGSGISDLQLISGDDHKSIQARRKTVEEYNRTGYIAKPVNEAINVGLASQDPLVVASTVNYIKSFQDTAAGTPSIAKINMTQEQRRIIETYDADTAAKLIVANKTRTEADRKANTEFVTSQKLDESGFSDFVQTVMPEHFGLFTSDADLQRKLQAEVERKIGDMAAVTGADVHAAYKMAWNDMNVGYDPVLNRIMRNPIGKVLEYGEYEGGEWFHRQLHEQVAEAGGEMGENYSYTVIPNHPMATPGNPVFNVTWINPDNYEYMSIIYKPEFNETPEGIQFNNEQQIKQLDEAAIRNQAMRINAVEQGDLGAEVLTAGEEWTRIKDKTGKLWGTMWEGSKAGAEMLYEGAEDIISLDFMKPESTKRRKETERKIEKRKEQERKGM